MLSINTNLSSLIAQRSMKQSTNSLNQAIERMTTGAKINHAKDNAVNYNIATNMTTKLGALQVAEDNALQGLEMINTTSETLSLIEDRLSRMRALAVQAQNGTYGEKSLSAINSEANALLNEITRLNESASYNGIKLFNTGKKEVTNAGKELEHNEQGFLQEVIWVDTSTMTKLSSVDPTATLAVGEYSISTPEELAQLAEMTNAGLLEAGSTFTLANDIDLSGKNWTGIGDSNPFKGEFNGNGYAILNLKGSRGVFIKVNQGSTTDPYSIIKNLKLENIDINSSFSTNGAICSEASGVKIINCSVKGSINANNFTGGILGSAKNTTTSYCYFNGNLTGGSTVGGITAYNNYSYTEYCLSEGSIKGTNRCGGVLGVGNATNSKSLASIQGVSLVGGIIGSSNCSGVGNCFLGKVEGNDSVGGIFGDIYHNVSLTSDAWLMEGCVNGDVDVGIFIGKTSKNITITPICYYYSPNVRGLNYVGSASNVNFDMIPQDISIPTDYTLQIGSSGDNKTSTISCTTYIDFSKLNSVLSTGIESTDSIEKIEELIKIAELKQVELGTVQNRLTSVIDEISTQYENLVSSRSTLQDADIAEVSSEYIRQQILQQASATLLATANQSASIALSLI